MTRISTAYDPFLDKLIEPDQAHTAMSDLALARATTAMAYRAAGSIMHYFWPDPSIAPYATISVKQTWTDFEVGDGTAITTTKFGVPWTVVPRHTSVTGYAIFGTETVDATFLLRLTREQLFDADSGDGTGGQSAAIGLMDFGNEYAWRQQAGLSITGLRYLMATCDVSTADIATTDSDTLIVPQIYLNQSDLSSLRTGIGGTVDVKLKSLVLLDRPVR